MPVLLLLLIHLLAASTAAAQADHLIGGTINLSLTEQGSSTSGGGGVTTRNVLGLEARVFKLWEFEEQRAFGLALSFSNTQNGQGMDNDRRVSVSSEMGISPFWRTYFAAPSAALQLWIQPAMRIGYGKQRIMSDQEGNRDTIRSYSGSIILSPGLIWKFANRWRLSIQLGGISYGYSNVKLLDQDFSTYSLALDLQLNPTQAFFGIEYRL